MTGAADSAGAGDLSGRAEEGIAAQLAAMPPLDPTALRRDVERLAALGPRFAGTEGESRARDFLAAELRATGLEVAIEEFTHLAYEPADSSCIVLDSGDEVHCAGLQATAAGAIEAEVVYVGDGVDAPADPIAGRILVFRNGVPTTVAPGLAARGAAGLIALSPAPDGLITHLTAAFLPTAGGSVEERVLPIPGVIVEAATGERLLARLSRGPTRVRIEHGASYTERTSANLIAEIPGTEPDAPKVVVGAHYDSQLESPGAADNATGLAALLAMARAWAGARPRRTIALVAFGVEESGSWGAADYVARHAREGIAAMINLDALGPPVDATRTIVADPRLATISAESARATGWEVEQELDARDFPYADHAPFIAAGIPATWIWRYPRPIPTTTRPATPPAGSISPVSPRTPPRPPSPPSASPPPLPSPPNPESRPRGRPFPPPPEPRSSLPTHTAA